MGTHDLFEGESIITQTKDNMITLTNFRIRYSYSTFGKAHIMSMMLEKVSSIEVHYKSHLAFLISGVAALIFGLIESQNYNSDMFQMALGLGGILLLIYVLTRRHVLSIKSDGGASIDFQIKRIGRNQILDFIYKIEKAKHKNK